MPIPAPAAVALFILGFLVVTGFVIDAIYAKRRERRWQEMLDKWDEYDRLIAEAEAQAAQEKDARRPYLTAEDHLDLARRAAARADQPTRQG